MNSSQEDLIEMSELSPRTKKPLPCPRLKKRNKIHSPPITTPIKIISKDLMPLFSIKTDADSVSETSNASSRGSRPFTSPFEEVQRESRRVDAKIEATRSKFHLNQRLDHNSPFSFAYNIDKIEHSNAESIEPLFSSPENLSFNLRLAAKDCLVASRKASVPENALPNPIEIRSMKVYSELSGHTYYHPPEPENDLKEVTAVKDYSILEFAIASIRFLHHPLFSLEHVLQRKLQQAFEAYEKSTISGNEIMEKINLARENREENSAQTRRKLRKLHTRCFKEAKTRRVLLQRVLDIWKAIKTLRSAQNYLTTRVRLIIKKEPFLDEENDPLRKLYGEFLLDILEGEENKNEIEERLKKRFEDSFKPFDEPTLTLYLTYENEPNADNSNNQQELDRVSTLATTKFIIKISCNNIPICNTEPSALNDEFILDFTQLISVQLTEVPQHLTLELFEHPKGLIKKRLAEIKVPVPHENVYYRDANYKETSFERKEIVHYTHAGVGCGPKLLPNYGIDLADVYTKGILEYKIGWRGSNRDNVASRLAETMVSLNKLGVLDEELLGTWLKESEDNRPELRMLEEYVNARRESRHFRLSPFNEKFTFCKPADIDLNIRFKYLLLRARNEIEFDGIIVANRIRELNFGLLKDYKKRKALEEEKCEDEDLESRRESGKRRLKQIYGRIFHMCKGLGNSLSYESVVDEKRLIYIEEFTRTLLRNLLNWFRWRPKISEPLPRPLAEPPPSPVRPLRLTVKVLGAKNVPRISKKTGEMRTLVEIRYEDNNYCYCQRTLAVSGIDPVWNERIELPLKCHHADYLNPAALNGSISVNLLTEEDNFWLGEVAVPLSGLVAGLNLCGWFKVKRPPLFIGHETENDEWSSATTSPKRSENTGKDTLIQLEVNMSPVAVLEPDWLNLFCNDVAFIKNHVIKWNEAFNASFPAKKFSALALDVNGNTNCITKYLRPLEPPQLSNEEFNVTPEQCLRYVSLIPFTETGGFYQNIWLTSRQLLTYMRGSVIDHCVTLTCFLLALKLDAYLLLGYGIPRGPTAYVLLTEHNRDSNIPTHFIFNVVYSEKISLSEPFCPLQRVYCVANSDNIWGNMQRTQNPALVRFDLSRKSDWWPLFDERVPVPSNSINNQISYDCSVNDCEHLEKELERKLKRKFSKWRPLERTTFNHRIGELFRRAMRHYELRCMYGKTVVNEALAEVDMLISQGTVHGLIFNEPFANSQSLLKKIKRLNLQHPQRETSEFALGVALHHYPGQVLSVWVFIAAVIPESQ